MINPAEIPQIPGDMAALSAHAATLSGVGTAFAATGARVHTTWQGLAAVYQAPEAAELLAATGPVQSVSASVGEDITAVGAALSTYATDVTAIKARLDALRAQATIFIDTIHTTAPDVDWRDDEGDVEHNNQLISDVNAAVADFMDAQRRCANTILALYSDQRYTAENADGTITQYEFGYTADVLDGAMAVDGALAWGTAEEHNRGFFGDLGAFGLGVRDGAVGMAVGLGMLGGYADGEWSWGTAGTAWAGLGTFTLALAVYGTGGAGLDQAGWIPGFEKGELGGTLLNTGKAIIAYDTWGEDKSRAAGMATFNILSTIIGTKGAGAGIRAGGTALEASRFAAIARAGTGTVRAGEFVGHLPTADRVIGSAMQRVGGLRIPHIDITDITAPTTYADTPDVRPPPVDAPRVETPDVETPDVPDGPSVGDAVARTPDNPSLDAPQARADASPVTVGADRAGADSPVIVGSARETVPGSGVNGDPGSALDGPRAAGADSPVDTIVDTSPDGSADPTPDSTPDGAEQATDGTPDRTEGLNPPLERPDIGTQPDGTWVGEEHGARLELDADVNTAADDLIRHATVAERTITPDIRAIVDGVDGARLQGHDYVLKSEDSLKRKLATEFELIPDLDASDALGKVRDSVRYTMEIPPGSYVDGVAHAVADLQARGFENVAFKPTWDNPGGYKGVNTNWIDPRTGQVFEVQFHTPDSFVAKMDSHTYYEALRVPGVSADEVVRLADEQAVIFGRVDVPAGVDSLHRIRDSLEQAARTPESSGPHHPPGPSRGLDADGATRHLPGRVENGP